MYDIEILIDNKYGTSTKFQKYLHSDGCIM